MEGLLKTCKGSKCECSCCSRGYGESKEEFRKSPRNKVLKVLQQNGISIENHPLDENLVWYSGCSDGENCKILALFPGKDIRSLVCKIFPYNVLEVSGGGITKEKDTIGIYLSNCPATKPNYSVPDRFTIEVKNLVKEHYKEYFDRNVDVIKIEKPQFC